MGVDGSTLEMVLLVNAFIGQKQQHSLTVTMTNKIAKHLYPQTKIDVVHK